LTQTKQDPKYRQGVTTGRPPKYTDTKTLQADVDAYFVHCDNTVINKQHVTGKVDIVIIPTPTPYTMAGLAYWLDMTRETLNQYKYDDMFSDVIARARAKIGEANITLALAGCHDSRIAALNLASNFGYASKQEHTVDSDGIEALLHRLHNKTPGSSGISGGRND